MLIAAFYLTSLPDSLGLGWLLIQGLYHLFAVVMLPGVCPPPGRNYWSKFRVDMPGVQVQGYDFCSGAMRHKLKALLLFESLCRSCNRAQQKEENFPLIYFSSTFEVCCSALNMKDLFSILLIYTIAFFCVAVHYCKHSHFLLLARSALNDFHSWWKTNLLENKFLGLKDF